MMNKVSLAQIVNYNGRKAVELWADNTAPAILEQHDSLEVLAYLTKHKVAIERLIDRVKEQAKSRVGSKAELYHGVSFSVRNTGKYVYNHDKTWLRLKDALDRHQALMQSLTEPLDRLDPVTGEVETIQPAVKSGSTSLFATFE